MLGAPYWFFGCYLEIAADVFSHLSAESQAQLSVLVNEQELRIFWMI